MDYHVGENRNLQCSTFKLGWGAAVDAQLHCKDQNLTKEDPDLRLVKKSTVASS